jgi:hypothetical protein
VSGGTNLFKEKMNVNFGMTLNPYAINSKGETIDKFNIDNGGSLFRMTSANITLNYSLTNRNDKEKDKKNDSFNNQSLRNGGREDGLFGTANDFSDSRQKNTEKEDRFDGFYNAKLPWDIRLAYSLTYSNNNRENKITQSSLMVSGKFDISPKWGMGVSTGYDFVQKGVTYTQLNFDRDLLSWRMNFQWNPFGDRASWYFFIGISSSVLKDIKWDKRNLPDRRL